MSVATAAPEAVIEAFLRLAELHPLIKAGSEFYPIADLCPLYFPGGRAVMTDQKGFVASHLTDEAGQFGYVMERISGAAHIEFIILCVGDDEYLIQPFPEGS